MKSRALAFLAALVAAASLSGCASSNYSQADDTSESMVKTSGSLEKGKAQVDSVLSALDGVVAAKGGDLRKPYDKFADEVDKTEKAAEGAKKTAASMRAKADERFQQWVKESEKVTDPELKQAALNRRDEAKKSFGKVTDAMEKAKTAYEPFIASLKDVRVVLGQDLTAHGVDAASSAIQRAKTEGAKLQSAISDVQNAMSGIRAELTSPKGGAPAK